MLACIRCGACLNVCPVYRRIGGHAYDAVYSGPMGKVLTPLLSGGAEGRDLPGASTLCGACTEACPVEIPLADMLVRLRADLRDGRPFAPASWHAPDEPVAHHERLPGEGFAWPAARAPLPVRSARRRRVRGTGFAVWAWAWSSPSRYRASNAAARAGSRVLGRAWAKRAPGLRGWTATRDLPLPASAPFRVRWQQREKSGSW
jgi:L-lactate dehydrogenase complex protein LldF